MEIITDLIPTGSINRPCEPCSMQYITVHETANTSAGANAESHAKYIKTIKNMTSWHYTVDDISIYQHIPDNEKAYHTSSRVANEKSISIEICVNSDGDFEKAKSNAAKLINGLMKKYNIPSDNVVSHKYWTGKNCPAKILKSGFDEFVKQCSECSKKTLYRVQIGAFETRENAEKLAERAKSAGFSVIIKEDNE